MIDRIDQAMNHLTALYFELMNAFEA